MDISVDLSPLKFSTGLNHMYRVMRESHQANSPASKEATEVYVELIAECEKHRPTDTNGKHTDKLHTPTCGCEDKGPCRYEMKDIQGVDVMMCRVHDRNSKHDVSVYPYQPCLAIDPWEKDEELSNPSTHIKVVHCALVREPTSACGAFAHGDEITPFSSKVTCKQCLERMPL